jgi:hypothetical protein
MSRRTLILAGIALGLSLWLIVLIREMPDRTDSVPVSASAGVPKVETPMPGQVAATPATVLDPEAGAPEQTSPSGVYLILSGTGEIVNWTSRTPASRRTEVVRFNEGLLTAEPILKPGDRFEIQLHGKSPLVSTVSEVQVWGNGTVAVSGRLPDDPHSRVFLSYTDGRATLLIQDRAAGTSYKVEYAHHLRAYVALEVDREACDILGCGVHDAHQHSSGDSPAGGDESPNYRQLEDASFPETVTLDVLVVYSPAARAYEGSVADMENAISLAFQLGNDTHGNSDTRIFLDLVHSEEVVYTEDAIEDENSALKYLDNLRYIDDVIDNVHTLRDTYAADFVVFVVDTEATGGLAGMPGSSYNQDDVAFSIVRGEQLDFTYTMVHEIAHNMGMGHSATQTVQPFTGGIYPYAAGWQWADGTSPASVGYCTVMTYENFDDAGTDEYERVAHFSNPDVQYNGNNTGSAGAADGARVMRNGRFDYSAFRGPKAIPSTAVTAFPDTLDFEEYFGIWYQPDTDDLDWERDGDGTPTPDSGPSAPYAGSFYAYIEMSGFNPGDEGLLTTILDLSGLANSEIDFAYHMYGGGMGSLYLEVSTDGGSNWSELWSAVGDQGDSWYTQNVSLSLHDGQTIRLRFRGVRGADFRSDMALDDIVISASPAVPTFTTFVDTNYPGLADKTAGGDPDFDGVSNFLEYAFGMLLDTPDADAGPSTAYDDVAEELSITFRRAQAGVRYVVESTDDLDFAGSALVEWDSDLSPPGLVPVGDIQTVDVAMPVGGKLFLQVNATE